MYETAAVVASLRWSQVDGPPRPTMQPTKTSRTRRISISRTEVAEELFFTILDRSSLFYFLCFYSTWIGDLAHSLCNGCSTRALIYRENVVFGFCLVWQ